MCILLRDECVSDGISGLAVLSLPLCLSWSFLFCLVHAHIHSQKQSASANEKMCNDNWNNIIRSAREVESALW